MKALVFGSTGLIGAHLIKRLIQEGHDVTGVSRGPQKDKLKSYRHISADVSRMDDFAKIKGKFDIIFNMAAHIVTGYSTAEAELCLLVNSLGTLNILEFMVNHGIKNLIHSSSVTVYGRPKRRIAYEDSPTNPIIVYGVSKLTAEKYCNMFSALHKLNITILRYASVYGPGLTQYTALPIFIQKAQKNETIFLFGDGTRSQDYVYIDDVIEVNILSAQKLRSGTYNIGSGKKTTMKDLAETIVNVFHSSSKIRYDPSKPQEFSIGIDITKAEKELGYKPRFNLRDGLSKYKKATK